MPNYNPDTQLFCDHCSTRLRRHYAVNCADCSDPGCSYCFTACLPKVHVENSLLRYDCFICRHCAEDRVKDVAIFCSVCDRNQYDMGLEYREEHPHAVCCVGGL